MAWPSVELVVVEVAVVVLVEVREDEERELALRERAHDARRQQELAEGQRAVLVEVRPVEDDGVHEALEERRRVDVDEVEELVVRDLVVVAGRLVEEHPVARQVPICKVEEVQSQRGQAGVARTSARTVP